MRFPNAVDQATAERSLRNSLAIIHLARRELDTAERAETLIQQQANAESIADAYEILATADWQIIANAANEIRLARGE